MRRRRWPWMAGGAAAMAAAGVLVASAVVASPQTGDARDPVADRDTVEVTRGDLSEAVRQKGTLRYAGQRQLGTSLGGTITALPDDGEIIERGEELLRIDDEPILLLYGDLPAWRSFESGMSDGRDVEQLEKNLDALGLFDGDVDERFTWWTAEAVRKWQKSVGLARDGRLDLGRVAFEPGEIRVASASAEVGDASSPTALNVTSTKKEIRASIDPNLAALAVEGASTTASLPGGTRAEATIDDVGSPVEEDDGSGSAKLRLPVRLTLDDPAKAEGLDNVGVDLQFSRTVREDVLRVPILALLAQQGGGVAVEVVEDGALRTVEIEVGAFADGLVEVTSGDIAEGDAVVVGK